MNVNEDMQFIQDALDDYEKALCLPAAAPPGMEIELDEYLNMPRNALAKLTPTGCAEISYRLLQYGWYLTRAMNKESSRVLWCKAKLNEYGTTSTNLRIIKDLFGSHEFKMSAVAKENSVVAKIIQIKDYAEQRKARLDGLSKHLQALAGSLKDNQIAKVSENKHG